MLSLIEIHESNRNMWDREIAKFENVHPLNAFAWGKARSIDGWFPKYIMAKSGGSTVGAVMLLTKRIPFSGISIMYAPRGPLFELSDREAFRSLLSMIRDEAIKQKAIFVRIDPNILENDMLNRADPFVEEGLIHLAQRWTFWNTPRDVYRIDLTRSSSAEELFSTLDRQARKAVRKARKQGVVIKRATSLTELNMFYNIFKQFSIDKGFLSRGYAYQKCLWDEFISKGNGELFVAVYQGHIIGGLLCLIFGQKCLAMHMSTPHEYSNLRTNDACVWEAIKSAKEKGCQWFSFRGVGTTPTQERFKRKFGPEIVSLVGYYDLPLYPWIYRLFNFGEFEILPRVWTGLMKARRLSKSITDQNN
jgi:peptidoglycan pentaglycine glycine transferase (the first glycine)